MRTTLAQRLVNPLFERCFSLIKHVLTVWPLTSISACLVTKQCLMMFAVAKHFPFGQAFRGGISQKIGYYVELNMFQDTFKTENVQKYPVIRLNLPTLMQKKERAPLQKSGIDIRFSLPRNDPVNWVARDIATTEQL